MDNENTTEQDPLSAAAQGWVAPEYPCLVPDRIVQLRIAKCTKGTVKDNQSRELLTLTLKGVDGKEYTDTKGQPMKNFSAFHRIGITVIEPTDEKPRGRSIKDIKTDLDNLLLCCGIKTSARDLINNPSMVEGHVVDMKVSLIPAKGQYAESNGFKFVQPS